MGTTFKTSSEWKVISAGLCPLTPFIAFFGFDTPLETTADFSNVYSRALSWKPIFKQTSLSSIRGLHCVHQSSPNWNLNRLKTSFATACCILSPFSWAHPGSDQAVEHSSSDNCASGHGFNLYPTKQFSKWATQLGTSNKGSLRRYLEKTCFAARETISCNATFFR